MKRGFTVRRFKDEATGSLGRPKTKPGDKVTTTANDLLNQVNSLRPLVKGPVKPGHGVIKPIAEKV